MKDGLRRSLKDMGRRGLLTSTDLLTGWRHYWNLISELGKGYPEVIQANVIGGRLAVRAQWWISTTHALAE